MRLTRGTPTPADDVIVHRGQTWVTVTSPVEGTSYVTAFAPGVYGWDRHQQTAMIHWLDAQWQFPPPAINAAGTRHVFTTMVMRQSDQSPRAGWIVRYTISGGPPAAFAATGGPTVEVQTDATGRASAGSYQPQPTCGTNAIGILVIRPAGSCGLTSPLVVGSGGTSKTWSAPGLAHPHERAGYCQRRRHRHLSLGAVEPRRPARGGHCRDRRNSRGIFLPYQQASGRERRAHDPLAAAKARPRPVLFDGVGFAHRSDRERHELREATAAGGLRSRECVTTTVSASLPAGPGTALGTTVVPRPAPPPAGPSTPSPTLAVPARMPPVLEVKVTGPERVTVEKRVTFEFSVENVGTARASGLEIRVHFDPGLEHAVAPSPIKAPLKNLEPGETTSRGVEFRAIRAGKQCIEVEITGTGGVRATAEGCTTVAEAPAPTPPPKPSPPPGEKLSLRVGKPDTSPTETAKTPQSKPSRSNARPPAGAGTGGLRMTLASLTQPARVGKEFTYKIEVTNQTPAHDVALTVTLPENLRPVPLGTIPGDATIDGREVRFPPLANLFGGEPRVYYVRVLPQKPGDAKVRAQLTQRGSPQPILVDTVTQILP